MLFVLSCRSLLKNVQLRSINRFTRACSTSSTTVLDFKAIKYPTKVPLKPVVSVDTIKTEKVKINKETIELLMRLSLVNLSDELVK